jgi:zinc protease
MDFRTRRRPLRRPFWLVALLGLAPLPGVAQEVPFERFQLENGLTVIFHEDHTLPLVAVNLWYYVGAKDEPPGRSGFAHLFEHLMFMGTKKYPEGEFDRITEEVGGSNNATTSADRTNYFESGPRELLEPFLELEADRMASLADAMTLEKLNNQRGIVRNERRQRFDNQPYGAVGLEIPKRMYPPGHPYHEPVIGSHEEIEAATVDDVRGFFDTFYFPRNASLVVAGDFDPKEARALVDKHFAALPARPALERNHPPVPSIPKEGRGPVRVTLEDQIQLPLSIMVWHSPPLYKSGDAEMDIVAGALSDGKASRLYRSLVYEKKLAQDVRAYQMSLYLGSQFRIYAYARPGVSLDELEKAVDEEVRKLRDKGPTQREIDRARNKFERYYWGAVQGLNERADILNQYQFHYGDPGAISKDLARYSTLTGSGVRDWAQKILRDEDRLLLRVVPKAPPATQE